MSGDGVGDGRVLLLVQRVIAAHHPLQFGELADHAGQQIGLGQDGGALGKVGLGTDQRRDLARQQPQALDAVILAAELVVENNVLQLQHAVFERHLAVLIEEELGVGEPRGDHPLTAFDDGVAAVLGLQIGD